MGFAENPTSLSCADMAEPQFFLPSSGSIVVPRQLQGCLPDHVLAIRRPCLVLPVAYPVSITRLHTKCTLLKRIYAI